MSARLSKSFKLELLSDSINSHTHHFYIIYNSRYCIVFFYKTLGFGIPNKEYWNLMCEDGFDVESAIGKKLGKR